LYVLSECAGYPGPFAGIVTLHWLFCHVVELVPQAAFTVSWIPDDADPIVNPAAYE
jgi:hypothetical protein